MLVAVAATGMGAGAGAGARKGGSVHVVRPIAAPGINMWPAEYRSIF